MGGSVSIEVNSCAIERYQYQAPKQIQICLCWPMELIDIVMQYVIVPEVYYVEHLKALASRCQVIYNILGVNWKLVVQVAFRSREFLFLTKTCHILDTRTFKLLLERYLICLVKSSDVEDSLYAEEVDIFYKAILQYLQDYNEYKTYIRSSQINILDDISRRYLELESPYMRLKVLDLYGLFEL